MREVPSKKTDFDVVIQFIAQKQEQKDIRISLYRNFLPLRAQKNGPEGPPFQTISLKAIIRFRLRLPAP
jgi:hypothetical protein